MVGAPEPGPTTSYAPAPAQRGALWYQLDLTGDALRVRLRMNAPPAAASFFLPGPWAGQDDFDERIVVESTQGPSGALPMHLVREAGRIDVNAGDVAWLELTYRVRPPRAGEAHSRFHPRRTANELFAYAPTIFVLPSEGLARQVRDIPIEIHTPRGWNVSATWPPHAATTLSARGDRLITGYLAENVRTLRDAFVLAGEDLPSRRVELHPGTLTVVQSPAMRFSIDELTGPSARIVRRFMARYGIYDDVVAAILPNDAATEGSELQGMGRRGGFVVQVPPHQQMGPELLLLMAHEALHMWNGHELVPAPEAEAETRWFKEGLTHYLALKALAREGLVDRRALLRELAAAAQHYSQNPLARREAANDLDQARFPYDRGLLIALSLDIALSEASQGRVQLERWLVQLLKPHLRDTARAYDTALLERAFREICDTLGPEPVQRFERLVREESPIDPRALFTELNLHWLAPGGGGPARLLPIEGEPAKFDLLFDADLAR
ncbi:hypothetical protein EA187_02185 [Lujinxingia sediminis]|uniref:Peptidase M61 catalytic domain-containing protein n=1 Tax=Lujinxingia sediminis TaxID=2480984 RepID=A0ABY0CWK0_9DELT|nr:hypothetical protein [Lujinxingia sediminis]RVU48267.1 hypothetical protein EA187_02185 [Lujinxingia sediminis]